MFVVVVVLVGTHLCMGKVQNTLALYENQARLHTLNAIFDLSVQLLQTLNILL